MKIEGILLAAGESRRMGEFKQLLPFRGKTFVENCLDSMLASRLDAVTVVTGHRAEEVRKAAGSRKINFVHNPQYREGMLSSLKCGVSRLSPGIDAFLIALVDQPHIGPELIDALIEKFAEDRSALLVVPKCRGKRGHPVIVDVRLKEAVLKADPAVGLKAVMRDYGNRLVEAAVSDSGILQDFDYPDDLKALK